MGGFQRLKMILYADVLLCSNIDEPSEIVNIYDKVFTRFGLKMSTDKTETMAFNVAEDIKSKPSLISVGGVELKNVCKFKYLGHMITNNDEDPSHFLTLRISSAFQKWNELKHVLTDRKIYMSTRIRFLEAYIRSRLFYSAQSWELSASELRKLETIWHGFLRKMTTSGFKRKNVPKEYLKARKKAKKSKTSIPEPEDLNWAYVFSNEKLREITKTTGITNFCKIQHLKYVAHVTRLGNDYFQKQLLFATDHKKIFS